MSIDHLKKQAKALRKLLPDFVREHSSEPTLAACQELIARCSGYPSFHAAATARQGAPSDDPWEREQQQLVASLRPHLAWSRTFGDAQSEAATLEGIVSMRLDLKPGSDLSAAEDRLDDYLESASLDPANDSAATQAHLRELVSLCESQIDSAPWFIDAHAHLVSALTRLGQPKDAFMRGRPVLDALIQLLPGRDSFTGRISWYELPNRPFHRLAFNVAAAYLANASEGDGFRLRAQEIVDMFIKWWPNDNLGFRYLLRSKP